MCTSMNRNNVKKIASMACHDLIADSEQAATDEDNKSKAKRIKETSYGR